MTVLKQQNHSKSRPAFFLFFIALLTLTTVARAQNSDISIYVTSTTANYAFFNSTAGSNTVYKGVSSGIGGGLTANFTGNHRTTLGIDIQGASDPADNGGAFGLVSLRVGYVPHKFRLRPFIQVGGGVVSANERPQDFPGPFNTVNVRPTNSVRVTNGTLSAAAGLDIRLTRLLDLRLAEFGVAPDTSTTFDRVGVGFVSSGLVLHLPGIRARR